MGSAFDMAQTGHGGEAPPGLLAALARAPGDLNGLGDAIAGALIGPLAVIASVNLYDQFAHRLEPVGAAAWDQRADEDLREYLTSVTAGFRRRLSDETVATGRPQTADLRSPGNGPADGPPAFLGREVTHNLMVPVRAGDEILGTLQVARGSAYGEHDIETVVAAGELCGPAVATARLLSRLRREHRIARAMAGNIGVEHLFAAVLPELREVLEVDTVRVLLLSEDGETLQGGLTIGIGLDDDGPEVPLGVGFAGRVASERRPLVVEDLASYPVHSPALRASGLISMAGVPVANSDLLGVLRVGSFTPRRFTADDIHLLQLVADRLALALAQGRVEDALRRAQALAQSVLDTAADAILTFDGAGRVASANRSLERLFGVPAAELVGSPVELLVPELDRRRLRAGQDSYEVVGRRGDGTRVPIDLSVSEVAGHPDGRLFTAILRDASERRAGEARLRHQALHDTLTRLPNRALFSEHLELAVARRGRQSRQLAVMFLDLDRFKVINDSLGHAAGDELLCQVATRLRATVRPEDVLARLGGDEFAVLLEGVMPLAATSVARRILERFDEPFVIENQPLHMATSIGIAHTADEQQSASDLLRHADAAMYQAKAQGRGRFDVFDEPMRASLHRRLQTENELHAALARGEIAVHYQPLLDLRSRKIARIEALARWNHPQRGILAAEEFIDVAEETGLIKLLGLQVARQTAQQLSAWSDDLGDATPQVAINLSPSQLAVPIDPILEVTEGYMHHLAIEITESALMTDVERVAGRLRDLKDRGATVIIDDFGTGYSSLSALKRLPIDVIKIDRAFVDGVEDDADDRAIVKAIIQLGHALGIVVVAEGVETARQLSILEELDCDLAQGYLISPPRPAGDVLAVTSS